MATKKPAKSATASKGRATSKPRAAKPTKAAKAARPAKAKAPGPSEPRASQRLLAVPTASASGGLVGVIRSLLDEMLGGRFEFLIFVKKDFADYYVQFCPIDEGMASEAVSNQFLYGKHRLGAGAIRRLGELGWKAPESTERPNFYREWPSPVAVDEAARFAASTLEEIFGVREAADVLVDLGDNEPVPILA